MLELPLPEAPAGCDPCAGYLEHPSMQLELMPRKARTGKESTTHEYAGGYLDNQAERERLRLIHSRKRGEGIL